MRLWLNFSQEMQNIGGCLEKFLDYGMSLNLEVEKQWKARWELRHKPINRAHFVWQAVRDYTIVGRVNGVVEKPSRHVVQVAWRPTQTGWIKLNTDMSSKEWGRIGCSGVLHGSDGEWLGGFCKVYWLLECIFGLSYGKLCRVLTILEDFNLERWNYM
jgi:hypothetical protein